MMTHPEAKEFSDLIGEYISLSKRFAERFNKEEAQCLRELGVSPQLYGEAIGKRLVVVADKIKKMKGFF